MASFTQIFAERARQQGPQVAAAFSGEPLSDLDRRLRMELGERWLPLSPEPGHRDPVFASDGSQAVRHFNNGWLVIVAQALLVGPGCAEPLVDLRFARANLPEPVVHRYAGLLMRRLELQAALRAVPRASGGILCLDGSIATEVPHLLYPLAIEGQADLPLQVLAAHLELLDACRRDDVLLVGISKTTTASSLTEALLVLTDADSLPPDAEPQPLFDCPCDSEVLFRWTSGPGLTQPLVLGVHALGHRRDQLMSAPEDLARAFESAGGQAYRPDERVQLLERLKASPAMVTVHLRVNSGEDPLKVETPGWALGLPDGLDELYFRWAAPDCANALVASLLGTYGGERVYNAPVYVADQLVRLSGALMDGPYLAVLRSCLGQYVQYDRSRRRFL